MIAFSNQFFALSPIENQKLNFDEQERHDESFVNFLAAANALTDARFAVAQSEQFEAESGAENCLFALAQADATNSQLVSNVGTVNQINASPAAAFDNNSAALKNEKNAPTNFHDAVFNELQDNQPSFTPETLKVKKEVLVNAAFAQVQALEQSQSFVVPTKSAASTEPAAFVAANDQAGAPLAAANVGADFKNRQDSRSENLNFENVETATFEDQQSSRLEPATTKRFVSLSNQIPAIQIAASNRMTNKVEQSLVLRSDSPEVGESSIDSSKTSSKFELSSRFDSLFGENSGAIRSSDDLQIMRRADLMRQAPKLLPQLKIVTAQPNFESSENCDFFGSSINKEFVASENEAVVLNGELLSQETKFQLGSDKTIGEAANSIVEPAMVSGQILEPLLTTAKKTLGTDQPQKIRIKLNPEELGTVEIRLEVGGDGKLHAELTTDNAGAKQVLDRSLSQLQTVLEDAGWQVERLDVWLGQPNDNGSTDQNRHHSNRADQSEIDFSKIESVEENELIEITGVRANKLISVLA